MPFESLKNPAITVAEANAAYVAQESLGLLPLGLDVHKLGSLLARGTTGAWDARIVESGNPFYDPATMRFGIVYTGYADDGSGNPTSGQVGLAWSEAGPEGPYTKVGAILGGTGVEGDADRGGATGPAMYVTVDGAGTPTYWLYYIGVGGVSGYEADPITIALASTSSLEGTITWDRLGTQVDLGVAGGWRALDVYHPCIVERDGVFYMFFNAHGTVDSVVKERIGFATASSIDGPWVVDDDNSPVLDVGGVGEWDVNRIADPSVYRVGDVWVMWYAGWEAADANPSGGVAVTSDADFPLGWEKLDANPLLAPTARSPYDSGAATKPLAMRVNGRTYLFYTSGTAGSPNQHISLAVSKVGAQTGRDTWVDGRWQFDPAIDATNDYSLLVGENITPTTGISRRKFVVGSQTTSADVVVGQASNRNVLLSWIYNATVASAYATLETYGGGNELRLQNNAGGLRIGGTGGKVGFLGTTPIVRPTGTPAAATDLATAITLVNDLRTKLLALGLIA